MAKFTNNVTKVSSTVGYHSLSHARNDSASTKSQSKQTMQRRSLWPPIESQIFHFLCYVSIAVVPLTIAILLPTNMARLRSADIFQGLAIGGSLTLSQAKAVDFVSSAVFAPLILTSSNYAWFATARTPIANDQNRQRRGVSVYAFVEASGTASGAYDILKLWTLLSSSSIPLILLAALTLFAALARSSLSNIIAYEAYDMRQGDISARLRLMIGASMMGSVQQHNNPDMNPWYATWNQVQIYSQQFGQPVNQVTYQNSTIYLNDSAYIDYNVTRASLDSVDSTITELYSVPILRAEVECQPYTPQSLRWRNTSGVGADVWMDQEEGFGMYDNVTGWHTIMGRPFNMFVPYGDLSPGGPVPFFAANAHNMSVYVGIMSSSTAQMNYSKVLDWLDTSTEPVSSPFGTIQAASFNLSNTMINSSSDELEFMPCYVDGAGHNGCTIVVWGLICTITKHNGTTNLNRASGDSSRSMGHLGLDPEPQLVGIDTYNPNDLLRAAIASSAASCNVSTTNNIYGCADANVGSRPADYDYRALADNFLFAEMEQSRIGLEIGSMPESYAAETSPDQWINVTSAHTVQRYRMTYVPALLFVGLACVFLAAALSISLAWRSARSLGNQQFRTVDSLRLLVDFAMNIQEEKLIDDEARGGRTESWKLGQRNSW